MQQQRGTLVDTRVHIHIPYSRNLLGTLGSWGQHKSIGFAYVATIKRLKSVPLLATCRMKTLVNICTFIRLTFRERLSNGASGGEKLVYLRIFMSICWPRTNKKPSGISPTSQSHHHHRLLFRQSVNRPAYVNFSWVQRNRK